jgi:hypothetical protein
MFSKDISGNADWKLIGGTTAKNYFSVFARMWMIWLTR